MTSIDRPLEEAIKLARAANLKFAELVVDDGSLLAALTGDRLPIASNLLRRFAEEWLPDRSSAMTRTTSPNPPAGTDRCQGPLDLSDARLFDQGVQQGPRRGARV